MKEKFLGEGLIFIISQPRSGSTLLQRILFGHPDIQTSAETWLMLHPVYGQKMTGVEAEFGSRFAALGVAEFLKNYTSGEDLYNDAIRTWAQVIYSNALQVNNKKYFLDKTPRYFFIVPEIYHLFPKAKFIFLIRNPLAVLASELSTYAKGDWSVLGVFQSDLLMAPTRILEAIDLLGDNAITIKYEEFVTEPETHISTLCQQLGISFQEEMLNYSNTPQPIGKMNDPTGIHEHNSPATTSVDKWKKMTEDDQSLHFARSYLNSLGKNTIERLGYSYDDISRILYDKNKEINTNNLFPWNTAIRPKKDWTIREQYIAKKYYAVKKRGSFLGTLSAIKNIIIDILKTFKYQSSRPEPPRYK